MAFGDRKSKRVVFQRGVPAQLVAINESWRMPCLVCDVSRSGAKIALPGARPANIDLKEFSLKFCAAVTRRCRLVRIDGDHIGVEYVQASAN